ncbi:TetR family transcriptional regulator C-terminal domain-containing protein [Saccharothrix sp. 6-C]|uniref:TetR/AcrR family transcriptional regulator n=1 Tax=Saccharothrix sp. 6-C TaxID=2781735 RepID=UPI0019176E98|nr:TetR/AcrR family transcriptional regulator [Saccharothrix sp. 6-C]QQQ76129.1 TetR family transcriptional regulator C-terminal domain-containing protein [Saccharothrix sp. 6-C]
MPKQVEYESRRRQITDAVLLLADERGLEGVTLRDVAARADVSMGAVQRCFRTKEEMLRFALEEVGKRVLGRVGDTAAEAARAIALPERAEARVWLAFVAQAAVSPALAPVLRASYADLEAMFTRLFGDGTRARAVLALADGLTTHVLIGHLTPDQAREVLDRQLAGPAG